MRNLDRLSDDPFEGLEVIVVVKNGGARWSGLGHGKSHLREQFVRYEAWQESNGNHVTSQ